MRFSFTMRSNDTLICTRLCSLFIEYLPSVQRQLFTLLRQEREGHRVPDEQAHHDKLPRSFIGKVLRWALVEQVLKATSTAGKESK
jgi:hypothetical protein